MNFFSELRQQRRIADVQADAASAKRELSRSTEQIRELEDEVSRMTLITQALWEIVRDRLGVTEAEMQSIIESIDARNAAAGAAPQTVPCSKCARPVHVNAARCIYCGTPVDKTTGFFSKP